MTEENFDLASANAAVDKYFGAEAPVAPVLTAPEPGFFRLPGGYLRFGANSGFEYDAEVRELTGADEEYIDRVKRGKPEKLVEAILERGLVSIGGKKATKDTNGLMLLGDVEKALLEIRRATYGDTLEYEDLTCPHCRERFNLILTLEDIPEVKLDNPADRNFTVELRKGGTAHVHLPTISDIPEVSPDATDAELNTAHLARVIDRIEKDGKVTPVAGSIDEVRALSISDRRKILQELAKRKIGPNLGGVKFTHDVCGEEVPFPLSEGDLFPGL